MKQNEYFLYKMHERSLSLIDHVPMKYKHVPLF